jgi:hypothetical protein
LNALIAEVFEFFKDGKWHSLEDVQETFGIDYFAADQIVRFLANSRLLRLNTNGSQAIIDQNIQQILNDDSPQDDTISDNATESERENSD